MPNTVTINIKNCGCCGGSSSGEGATGEWYNDLGDPADPNGPPEGYSEPETTIADRQCKMAVWIYDWIYYILDTLANTTTGGILLLMLRRSVVSSVIRPVIVWLITTVIALFDPDGPGLQDPVKGLIAAAVIEQLVKNLPANVSQSAIQDIIPAIQAAQSDIICSLSRATNASDAWNKLEKVVDNIDGLSPEQEMIVLGFVPNMFLTMLFFTADWWPSFDDDYLSGITTTCCGSYVDGDPITAGSAEACQAANYIVDKLTEVFENTGGLISYSMSPNPFDDDKTAIYNRLSTALDIPPKVQELSNYPDYLTAVAEIIYSYWPFNVFFLPNFTALADYVTSIHGDTVCALFNAADEQTAYTDLRATLVDWILANVSDTDHQLKMTNAVDALIEPITGRAGLLGTLVTQDSEMLSYPTAVDCSGCGGGGGGALEIINGTLLNGDTSGDFELEAIFSANAGCNRWQTYIIPGTYAENVNFRVQILDATTPKCCGSSPCTAFSLGTDATLFDSSTFPLGTDFTRCWSLPGAGLLVRTTAKHRLIITRLGFC